jgi:hypothetical protein
LFDLLSGDALDAGRERINEECNAQVPEHTYFFNQGEKNEGLTENGVVTLAINGFKPKGSSGVLDLPEFTNADCTHPNIASSKLLSKVGFYQHIQLRKGTVSLTFRQLQYSHQMACVFSPVGVFCT